MTNSAKYYIWLTLALGFSNAKFKRLSQLYPSIEDFCLGGENEWRLSGLFSEKEISALENTPLEKAFEVISLCTKSEISVITFDDPDYPTRLFEIDDPPAVLYCKGRLPDFDHRLCIGMVGTRNATAYGKKAAYLLSASLSKVGVIVVSGGAMGVDTAAHTGALEAGGTTVCVLGCGVNHRYLSHNLSMRNAIAETGVLISEYPPDFPAAKFTFPERNRIISGLCEGIVVVEAGEKSGALITARRAIEQNRDVFAVMGNITSPYSAGSNRLIRDGAVPVFEYTDIIDAYPCYEIVAQRESVVEKIPKHKSEIDTSEDAKKIYYLLSAEDKHIDDIVALSGLEVRKVLESLTELEMDELIVSSPGRMYRLA